MKNGKTKYLIILAIAMTLVWGSSYLFLPNISAQKSADPVSASRDAYFATTVAAMPDKVEGLKPPAYLHYAFKTRLEKRQGGEDCASATVISSLPYNVTGTTGGYVNDYDCDDGPGCFATSTSPDVVYSYSPSTDVVVNIDLVGSSYDTKVFVFENDCGSSPDCYACDDDYYGYPTYISKIVELQLYGGNTYYIVVDGYGGASGEYVILVEAYQECDVVCPVEGIAEGEPTCYDYYDDTYNGGCNSYPYVFQDINCGDIICGTSGNYYYDGNYRDTDWFRITLADPSTITWKAVGEFPILIFVIEDNDCSNPDPYILGSATADICDTASLTFDVPAGVYWLWVGPSVFTGYDCGVEYVAKIECVTAETGACCYDLDPYTCTITTPAGCTDPDYTFQGLGTNCGPPNPCLPAPDNDDCENAITVTPGVPVYGSNVGATVDCPGVLDWNSTWYVFELPYDCNNLFIDYCPTDGYIYNIGLVLFDECPPDCPNYISCYPNYQWVTCASGWDNPQTWWDALPGGTYWLPVLALDSGGNPVDFGFEITVEECAGPPPNDDCASATAVGDVTDLPFNTDAATFDGGGTCMYGPNIWYCYTATCTGEATVSLCGSSYDTKLAVYDGCICDPLGTEIECNDDFCGTQSQITFAAVQDNEYLIEVGGYSTNTGDGILNIYCVGADQGACCNDLEPYDCQLLSETECNALSDHSFLGIGTDCDPNPCVPGNTCDLPIAVELPLDLPYLDRDQYTCGRGDNYDETCLGYYDGGEDIIYELTVTAPVYVMVTLDPKGLDYTGIALDDECPPADPCLYYSTAGYNTGDPYGFMADLPAGTYYIMVDTWPSPDCIPDFDLTIETLGPEIEVSPASLEQVLNADPPNNTADEIMNVTNTGYMDLNYSITENPEATWLSCLPTSGIVSPDMTDPVTVSFDASGMAPGVYNTELVVASDAVNDPEVHVPVQLTVELAPDISVEPGAMEMGVIPGCEMYSGVQVQNAGPGELRFEASVQGGSPLMILDEVRRINEESRLMQPKEPDPTLKSATQRSSPSSIVPSPGESPLAGAGGFTTKDRETLLSEGFEGTWPPPGWSDPDYWEQECVYYAYTGLCGAYLAWGYGLDEWLITPTLSLGATSSLTFWWESSYYWSVDPNDHADLFVKISTDGGGSWITLWTFGDSADVVNSGGPWPWGQFEWTQAYLDLTGYKGDVLIAFNVVADDNADIAIDDVVVETTGPACPFTVSPEDGTVPPGESDELVLTFDGTAFEECVDETVTCYLVISSNDPIDPVVSVPVDMWSGRGDVHPDPPCLHELGDILFLINFVLKGGPTPDPPCMGDCNRDGVDGDLQDVIYLIDYLYWGTEPPPLAAPKINQPPTPLELK